MEVQNQPKLLLHGVDFTEISFRTTKPYDNQHPIDLKVDPKVFYPNDLPKLFKIIMDVSLKSESFFDLKVVAVANFELGDVLSDEIKQTFIDTNAPAIMFPYVRSFISTLTSNMGGVTGHLLIPAQFFKGELKELSPGKKN